MVSSESGQQAHNAFVESSDKPTSVSLYNDNPCTRKAQIPRWRLHLRHTARCLFPIYNKNHCKKLGGREFKLTTSADSAGLPELYDINHMSYCRKFSWQLNFARFLKGDISRHFIFAVILKNFFVPSHQESLLESLKPWPNGLASLRKFWTCVQLAFRLATHLRGLALTLVELNLLNIHYMNL